MLVSCTYAGKKASHIKFMGKQGWNFPLLSDTEHNGAGII